MITEQDLQEAIAECLGQRNPNAGTCLKLAAYYIIKDNLFDREPELHEPVFYTRSGAGYSGKSDFAKLMQDVDDEKKWKLIDELMETLQVVNPKLYASVMRKAADL